MSYLDATRALTDDFGILQHTLNGKPRHDRGYALDDATRGLLLYLLADDTERASVLHRYIEASYKEEQWYGFATYKHDFIMAPASEDAIGQVAWAMGLAQDRGFEIERSQTIFNQAKASLRSPHYLRGSAYALLGAIYVDHEWATQLATTIKQRFAATTPDWPWPETTLTYANAIIPLALLRYGRLCNDPEAIELGRRLLTWIDQICNLNTPAGPIGSQGWFEAGMERPAQFGQQPIDVAYMIWAYLALYEIDHAETSLDQAESWLSWFYGNNIADKIIGDRTTGLCFDGIDGPDRLRVSRESGAESRVCFALTLRSLEQRQSF
jgi:hypothetical protein